MIRPSKDKTLHLHLQSATIHLILLEYLLLFIWQFYGFNFNKSFKMIMNEAFTESPAGGSFPASFFFSLSSSSLVDGHIKAGGKQTLKC